jgi:uncharacterized phage protein (TIGR01671 family)
MRDIIFRAYDKVRKEYLSSGQILISVEPRSRPEKSNFYLDILKDANMYNDRFVIEQYTGLKDKNGKLIYEGDIVKGFIPEMANEPERIGIVKFGNYGWIIDFETEKWECRIPKVGFCSFRNYEVIGNINEYPELLKKED